MTFPAEDWTTFFDELPTALIFFGMILSHGFHHAYVGTIKLILLLQLNKISIDRRIESTTMWCLRVLFSLCIVSRKATA